MGALDGSSIVEVREGKPVSREEFRKEVVAKIPAGYSPYFHLVFPSLIGLGSAATALAMLREVNLYDVWFIPLVYMASNAVEWRAHKDILHRRTPPHQLLYDRHTPVHHRVFMTDDMAIRDTREFALVLIPPYGILLILAVVAPLGGLLWHFNLHNAACFFVATTMLYVVSYEWLHLAYHLPATHPIARLGLIQKLKRHHATHHDPRLMQQWNFNVTVPLWDWVRGTIWRDRG